MVVIFETIFAVNILINFITAYIPDGELNPVTCLSKIFSHYVEDEFMEDLIPTLPVTFIFSMEKP
jgi:hypothetical protein